MASRMAGRIKKLTEDARKCAKGNKAILVCWCQREDGEHNPDCPSYGHRANDDDVIIRVAFDLEKL